MLNLLELLDRDLSLGAVVLLDAFHEKSARVFRALSAFLKEDVKVIFPRKKPFNRAIKPHKFQLIKNYKVDDRIPS